MKFITIICLMLLSPLLWAGGINLEVIDDGQSLEVTIDSIKNEIKIDVPEGTELDDKPLRYGGRDFIIAILQYSDFDSGTSVVYALDAKGKKLWSLDLEAFNPSAPLIEKDHVYLSDIGKIWKIEKKSGKIVWKHKDLYKTKKFNGAEPISRVSKMISFSSNLMVNDATGAVEEVKK